MPIQEAEAIVKNSHITRETKVLGAGGESLVYLATNDCVVKFPNINKVREGKKRPAAILRELTSPERGIAIQRDFEKSQSIFGNRLLDTVVVLTPHPFTGQDSFATVQSNMNNLGIVVWDSLNKNDQQELKTSPSLRAELLDMIWQMKKFCLEFKIPFDIHPGNIGIDRENMRLYVLEVSCPTRNRALLFGHDLPFDLRQTLLQQVISQNKTHFGHIETDLQITAAEKELLNAKYLDGKDFNFTEFLDNLRAEFDENERLYQEQLEQQRNGFQRIVQRIKQALTYK